MPVSRSDFTCLVLVNLGVEDRDRVLEFDLIKSQTRSTVLCSRILVKFAISSHTAYCQIFGTDQTSRNLTARKSPRPHSYWQFQIAHIISPTPQSLYLGLANLDRDYYP